MTKLMESLSSSMIMNFKLSNFFKKNILLIFVLSSFVGLSQQTINGTISDEDGVPLPGVNVVIKGTNTGTSTDFDGNYSISADQDDVLIFSFGIFGSRAGCWN